MSDDEYLREIVDDELDSIMGDPEVYEEYEQEQEVDFDELDGPSAEKPNNFMKRVYKRLLDEFPDYESENGPRKVLGWTIAKRRHIREKIKNFQDYRLMRCAIAATCKDLYNANAKRTELEVKPEFGKRELQFKDTPKKVWEVLVREWS